MRCPDAQMASSRMLMAWLWRIICRELGISQATYFNWNRPISIGNL
jgi:hypothetical protein